MVNTRSFQLSLIPPDNEIEDVNTDLYGLNDLYGMWREQGEEEQREVEEEGEEGGAQVMPMPLLPSSQFGMASKLRHFTY